MRVRSGASQSESVSPMSTASGSDTGVSGQCMSRLAIGVLRSSILRRKSSFVSPVTISRRRSVTVTSSRNNSTPTCSVIPVSRGSSVCATAGNRDEPNRRTATTPASILIIVGEKPVLQRVAGIEQELVPPRHEGGAVHLRDHRGVRAATHGLDNCAAERRCRSGSRSRSVARSRSRPGRAAGPGAR